MTDHHLFYLDAAQEWDLAADANQWIIRRRRSARKAPSGGSGGDQSAIYAWEPRWYVGSEKRVLHQFIEGGRGPPLSPEKRPRIVLTPEAVLALSELPDRFLTWRGGALECGAQEFQVDLAEPCVLGSGDDRHREYVPRQINMDAWAKIPRPGAEIGNITPRSGPLYDECNEIPAMLDRRAGDRYTEEAA